MKPTYPTAKLIAEKLHIFRRSRSFVLSEQLSQLTGAADRALVREIAYLDERLADANELNQWAIGNGNQRLCDLLEKLAASKAYRLARSSSQLANSLRGQVAEPTAYSELSLLLRRSLETEPILFWDNKLDLMMRANLYLRADHPAVSVIVPVYGSWSYPDIAITTLARTSGVTFELILVDDLSPEPVPIWLEYIPGVRVVRRSENGGFAEACNSGVEEAGAEKLLLLNMDMQIQHDTLLHLASRLDSSGTVGVVGGKLYFPNGTLQEAGGIVDADGSVANIGYGADHWHPDFNYVRVVDYVSGALLMTRTSLYREVGGLSNEFGAGYFEDTDFCLRVRQRGLDVVYEPAAQAVHAGGGSFSEEAKGKLMARNASCFYKKWGDELVVSSRLRSIRRSVRRKALVVDALVPVPDHDSGSKDTYMLIHAMREFGIDVAVYPTDQPELHGPSAKPLQSHGVEVLYGPYVTNLREVIECVGPVDVIFLFRYPAGGRHIHSFRSAAPYAKIVFVPVDLHYFRESRGALLGLSELNEGDLMDLRKRELDVAERADEVWVLSEDEAQELRTLFPKQTIRMVPFFRDEPNDMLGLPTFEQREDIGFIGNFRHRPNIDAVNWFVDNVWDKVLAQIPNLRLWIAGTDIEDALRDQWLKASNLEVVGWVPSEYDFLKSKLVSVAPLRFGAGIKGKVASSLLVGTPVVGTTVAFEGMNLGSDAVVFADSADEMALAVVAIVRNRERWLRLSESGYSHAQEQWSRRAGMRRLEEIFSQLNILPSLYH